MAQVAWDSATYVGDPDVLSGYLASAWSSPNRCSHSEREQMEDLFLFYLLTLSALE